MPVQQISTSTAVTGKVFQDPIEALGSPGRPVDVSLTDVVARQVKAQHARLTARFCVMHGTTDVAWPDPAEMNNGVQLNKCADCLIEWCVICAATLVDPRRPTPEEMLIPLGRRSRRPEDLASFIWAKRCVMRNCLIVGPAGETGSCAMLDASCEDCVVEDCLMINPGNVGAGIAGGRRNKVRNNVIYSAGGEFGGNVGLMFWPAHHGPDHGEGNEFSGNLLSFRNAAGAANLWWAEPHTPFDFKASGNRAVQAPFDPAGKIRVWLKKWGQTRGVS